MRKISGRMAGLALVLFSLPCVALDAGAHRLVAVSQETLAAAAPGSVALGGGMTRVPLVPNARAEPLARWVARHGSDRRFFLVLSDLHAAGQPGVIYEIYLGLPPGVRPGANDPHFVGTLNFFGIAPPNPAQHLSRSYDVSEMLRRMMSQGTPGAPLAVTIVPATGSPSGGSEASATQPNIGRIELIAQ